MSIFAETDLKLFLLFVWQHVSWVFLFDCGSQDCHNNKEMHCFLNDVMHLSTFIYLIVIMCGSAGVAETRQQTDYCTSA